MKMTDIQFAALNISLSTLGQADISDNDREMLETLEFLLEQALGNVRKALPVRGPDVREFEDHDGT
jgi:hypothetical protein